MSESYTIVVSQYITITCVDVVILYGLELHLLREILGALLLHILEHSTKQLLHSQIIRFIHPSNISLLNWK